jgi:hypothetical protein
MMFTVEGIIILRRETHMAKARDPITCNPCGRPMDFNNRRFKNARVGISITDESTRTWVTFMGTSVAVVVVVNRKTTGSVMIELLFYEGDLNHVSYDWRFADYCCFFWITTRT